MTEAEAIKKWCPMSQVPLSLTEDGYGITAVAVTANRTKDNRPLKGSLCFGSRCMMWAWDNDPEYCTDAEFPANGHCGLVRR